VAHVVTRPYTATAPPSRSGGRPGTSPSAHRTLTGGRHLLTACLNAAPNHWCSYRPGHAGAEATHTDRAPLSLTFTTGRASSAYPAAAVAFYVDNRHTSDRSPY